MKVSSFDIDMPYLFNLRIFIRELQNNNQFFCANSSRPERRNIRPRPVYFTFTRFFFVRLLRFYLPDGVERRSLRQARNVVVCNFGSSTALLCCPTDKVVPYAGRCGEFVIPQYGRAVARLTQSFDIEHQIFVYGNRNDIASVFGQGESPAKNPTMETT